ncbi:DUF982 domain-containing protein [Bosea sp. 2KB_26]
MRACKGAISGAGTVEDARAAFEEAARECDRPIG